MFLQLNWIELCESIRLSWTERMVEAKAHEESFLSLGLSQTKFKTID